MKDEVMGDFYFIVLFFCDTPFNIIKIIVYKVTKKKTS